MKSAHRTLAIAAAFASILNAGPPALAELVDDAAPALDAPKDQVPERLVALGLRYENAEGVPRDYARANALYCQAARRGDAEAQFRLGWAYANGRGVAHDDGRAALLFRLAAAQGHDYARRMLTYVSPKADTALPECMRPDPPAAPVEAAGSAGNDAAADAAVTNRVPPAIRSLVDRLAREYAVDAELVLAVIATESAFDAKAVSARNAQGLMQLMPDTAARFGVKHVFSPADNIRGGLAYLRWLLAYFRGHVPLVLAAYNAGEGAVEKYRGIPPYPETRSYVDRIIRAYGKQMHPYEARVTAPSRVFGAGASLREAASTAPY